MKTRLLFALCGLTVVAVALTAPAQAELIGHWAFDSGVAGSTVADLSAKNNHGGLTGSLATATTVSGPAAVPGMMALPIAGSSGQFTVASNSSLSFANNRFTIAMWVNDGFSSHYPRYFYTNAWELQGQAYHGGDAMYLRPPSWITTNALNNELKGAWHHLAVTGDGTHIKFYLDGVLKDTKNQTNSFAGNWGTLHIGTQTTRIDGPLGDVAIFNTAETDIAAIMAGTHPDMVRANWVAGQEWSKRISIGRTSGAAYNAVYSTTDDTAPGGPTVGVLVDGGTTARLWGTGTASSPTPVRMQWRARYESELELDGGGLVSDVLDLTGIAPLGGGATDEFVLAMSYQSSLPAYLAYWDDAIDEWIPAVDGNFGGTANYLGETAFLAGTHGLGDYGYQYDGQAGQWYAWAVLNHNSQFAVFAVPEPGTWLLLLSALACGLLVRRRR